MALPFWSKIPGLPLSCYIRVKSITGVAVTNGGLLEQTVEVQLDFVGELVKVGVLDFFRGKFEVLALEIIRKLEVVLPFWDILF